MALGHAAALLAGGALLVSGCASGGDSASGSSTPAGLAAPDTVEVVAVVEQGDVWPAPHRVAVRTGQTVRLRVTSDVADDVHVHGLEIKRQVSPGRQAVVEFVADAPPGPIVVELESRRTRLVQLDLR